MQINIEGQQLLELILKQLELKKSLFILRCGDGEMIMLKPFQNEKSTTHVLHKHLGYSLNEQELNQLSNDIKTSIIEADVLGLPEPRHIKLNEHWGKTLEVFEEIKRLNPTWKEKQYCSINVHLHFLKNKFLDMLLKKCEKVALMTCRNVEQKVLKNFPNIKNLQLYKIPPQHMFEEIESKEKFYPDIFLKVKEQINKENNSGKLLLFGGGYVGKALGAAFAKSGGVAFDIGSVFDMWVGKITRGLGKGKNSYTEPYLK
jgi:hypothetical protein